MYKIDLFIVKTTDFWATYGFTETFEASQDFNAYSLF